MIYVPRHEPLREFPFHPEEDPEKHLWYPDETDVVIPSRLSWVTDFIYHMRGYEAPTLLNIWTALVVLSAALRRNTWLATASEALFTNMYVVLVGPAGIAKKTTSMEKGMHVINMYNATWKKSLWYPVKRVEMFADDFTAEAVSKRLNRSSQPSFIVDPEGNTMYDPKTQKPLTYYGDSACLIYADELSSTFRSKYQHANLEFFKAIYSNKTIHKHETVGRGAQTMRNLHTNFLGTTTLDAFNSMPSGMYHDGFMSRLIVVYAFNTDRVYPEPFVPSHAPSYTDLANGLCYVSTLHQGPMELAPDAREWYIAWYHRMAEYINENPGRSGTMSRMQVHLRKVATLLAAARYDDGKIVTLGDMLDSYKLLTYTYAQNPLLGAGDIVDTEQNKLYLTAYERISQLLHRVQKPLTVKEIQGRCKIRNSYLPKEDIWHVITHLHMDKKCSIRTKTGAEIKDPSVTPVATTHTVIWRKYNEQ